MKSDQTYLKHILEAIEKIESYVGATDFTAFQKNNMMIDAVVRELQIIGEATKQISDDFRAQHNNIPWPKIRAMRNYLVHEYFGVNIKVVWDTCSNNLPVLKTYVRELLGLQ